MGTQSLRIPGREEYLGMQREGDPPYGGPPPTVQFLLPLTSARLACTPMR